jgi:hypothetical protein
MNGHNAHYTMNPTHKIGISNYIFKHNKNENNISIIRNYLNTEFTHYESLKKSEFFIKL